jgi:Na+:H+ antiporter, NhaA family
MRDTTRQPLLDPPVQPDDHRLGNGDSSVVLVEFGDYECPDCFGARLVVKEVLERLGDAVSLVWRHFPRVEVHPGAERAARAVEAAALQNRFWPVHEKMLAYQGRLEDDLLEIWIERLGLDLDRFRQDLVSPASLQRIERDRRSAERSGVRGTPTFFINGYRYEGRVGPDDLIEAIMPHQGR